MVSFRLVRGPRLEIKDITCSNSPSLVRGRSSVSESPLTSLANRRFADSTLALVDPDDRALDTSTRIVKRMIEASGASLTVESSSNRRDMLADCDYVLNSIAVGEPFARERDVEIGERYGIFQPTSQTVGPAGYCRGLRVLPHAVDIARGTAELAPNATIIDLANPLAAVCRGMIRESGLPVVGLCEQWAFTKRFFSRVLDTDPDTLDMFSVGTNHLTWALGLEHEGRDVLPELIDALYQPRNKAILDEVPVSDRVYRAFGVWPTGTEDHIAEFFNDFLTPETNGGADFGMKIRHTSEAQWEDRWKEREALASGESPIEELLGPSGENAVDIIAMLEGCHPPGFEMVNIPNNGLIDNLPDHAIVELPAHRPTRRPRPESRPIARRRSRDSLDSHYPTGTPHRRRDLRSSRHRRPWALFRRPDSHRRDRRKDPG